jgi:hypothetical protein
VSAATQAPRLEHRHREIEPAIGGALLRLHLHHPAVREVKARDPAHAAIGIEAAAEARADERHQLGAALVGLDHGEHADIVGQRVSAPLRACQCGREQDENDQRDAHPPSDTRRARQLRQRAGAGRE